MHLLFAWRYFKAKKSTNAINVIAWISVVAIMVGTAALIVVLSVFNGFEGLIKSLYSSFYTDLKVVPVSGKVLTLTQEQLDKFKGVQGIRNFALVVEEKALLQNGDYNQSITYIKGVDNNYRYVSGIEESLIKGKYDLGDVQNPRLIVGAGVENALGIYAESNISPLNIYLPRRSSKEQLDPANDIGSGTIQTAATFVIQRDFDNKYAITNLSYLKEALQLQPDEYSGVEIALINPKEETKVQQAIQKVLGSNYKVLTRYEQNQSLFAIMNLERWVIYGVLSLILVIAAFNMVGALTMLVLEKQKDINILFALGATKGFVKKLFLTEGLLLAGIGTVAGMLIALLIVWLQQTFHIVPIEGGSFLINYFPVELRWQDFVLVTVTVFVISVIASWMPAGKAANQNFSLRGE